MAIEQLHGLSARLDRRRQQTGHAVSECRTMAALGAESGRTMTRTHLLTALVATVAFVTTTAGHASEAVVPPAAAAIEGASHGKTAQSANWDYAPYRIVAYVEFDAAPEW